MLKVFNLFFSMLIAYPFLSAYAGVEVGGTRVIYYGDQKEANLSIKNPQNSNAYIIQSWLDNGDEENVANIPFVITPPLFRLDPNRENQIRIINTKPLPQDRESIYWLSVKSIAASTNQPNRLQISVRTRIKMIYRPGGIKSTARDAYKKLTVVRRNGEIIFTNPTPHYISFFSVHVGAKPINQPMMIAPMGIYSLPVPPGAVGKISWIAINDFGGQTDEVTR